MISLMLDHARLLCAGRVKLLQAHASPAPSQIGVSARMQMMPPARQSVVISGVPTEHDQVLDHESSAALQDSGHALQVRRIDLDLDHGDAFTASDPAIQIFDRSSPTV